MPLVNTTVIAYCKNPAFFTRILASCDSSRAHKHRSITSTVLEYSGTRVSQSVNTIVLVKLPKIPLLANKKSQTVHEISSLSQVMGLAADKLLPVIGSVHELTLVPKYSRCSYYTLQYDLA